jgi:uroporphyrinogen-III decarboxylase
MPGAILKRIAKSKGHISKEETGRRQLKMERKWSELTPDEKRAERFKRWLSPPDVKFSSPKAEKAYRERVTRIISALQLKEPDRVPVFLPASVFPAYYAGINLHTAMYDYDKLRRAWTKFFHDFDMDTYTGPATVIPGKVYDLLDYKLYSWPSHGLSPDSELYQCVEGEYMMADEYDALLKDPSDFYLRVYMPRVFGAFESFKKLRPFTDIVELPTGYFAPYTKPDVRASLQVLLDVGKELSKWMEAVAECNRLALESGVPSMAGGGARAPFDRLGDTMRGTKGIIMDMYRQPDKLLEALEVIATLTIDEAISSVNATGGIMVFFPLHKGADGFMSDKQFETFYWPTLKKCILALINEGITPSLFAEGSYTTRLEIVKDLPKGWVMWRFDRTDMARAKKVLGDTACITGNVPASLLHTGTPQDVKEYCRKLIEVCGKGGGYILAGGAGVGKVNPDNLRAMTEAAKEYGVY